MQSDMNTTRKHAGLIALGIGFMLAGSAAAAFEAWRNFEFGMQRGGIGYAGFYLLAAVGVILTQAGARPFGWLRMAAPFAMCALITAWAGFGFYSGDIRASIDAADAHVSVVMDARDDEKRLGAEITELEARWLKITETATSASLRAARDEAQRRADAEATRERGGCPAQVKRNGQMVESECRKAEREAAEYNRRLIDAEARERITAELRDARGRLDKSRAAATSAAPKDGSGQAFILSWAVGGTESEWRRMIGIGEPSAYVVGPLILAGLFWFGLKAFAEGMGWNAPEPAKTVEPDPAPAPASPPAEAPRRRAKAKAAKVEQVAAPEPEKPATIAQKVVAAVAPKPAAPLAAPKDQAEAAEAIALFVGERLDIGGGQILFSGIRAELERWWRARYREDAPRDDRIVTNALEAAGVVKVRRSNKGMVYGAAISNRARIAAV